MQFRDVSCRISRLYNREIFGRELPKNPPCSGIMKLDNAISVVSIEIFMSILYEILPMIIDWLDKKNRLPVHKKLGFQVCYFRKLHANISCPPNGTSCQPTYTRIGGLGFFHDCIWDLAWVNSMFKYFPHQIKYASFLLIWWWSN